MLPWGMCRFAPSIKHGTVHRPMHTPHDLATAFSFHQNLAEHGTMKGK